MNELAMKTQILLHLMIGLGCRRSIQTIVCLIFAGASLAAKSVSLPEVSCHTQEIEGVNIFYREAGPQGGPVLVLLHGFPSSSFYFRNLIPLMAGKYHVIAPDYPGF